MEIGEKWPIENWNLSKPNPAVANSNSCTELNL